MPESNAVVVPVELLDRSYEIKVGSGNLSSSAQWLVELCEPEHVVVISDSNVAPLYGEEFSAGLRDKNVRTDQLVVPAGETSKSIEHLNQLWEQMLQIRADRSTVVVALGGGVVGDLAGFVAASFGRGVRFFQVPTTLLAQVDSSVGGKVGINLSTAKNMVGAFWQPVGVSIDIDVLKTLPDREYFAGLAEVIKYGMILDLAFFEQLESQSAALLARDSSTLINVIAKCCELKAHVVKEDERETTGLRAVLNYGHTYAHAFESLAGYGNLLHGEAVAMGMVCASRLGELMGRVDSEATQRQVSLLQALNLPAEAPNHSSDEVLEVMRRDKKTSHGKLRFVVPDRIGHVELLGGIDVELVVRSLQPLAGN